ncbi:hypothetical protein KR044_008247 [Drosophila immigrans]|nr:hypothetical protein KR044_008247 [Drosophila immigrans]
MVNWLKLLLGILIFRMLEFLVLPQQLNLPLMSLHQCYLDVLPANESNALQDVLFADVKPIPGRAIFFLETKCQSSESNTLNARQACAIESAAFHNPNFQVFVLFANPKVIDPKDPFITIIRSYRNVHLRQLNIWRYAKETPVEDWIVRDNKFMSIYPTEHTSDLLRFLTLFRFGGIYLDMDIVVLRSLEELPLNYVGMQINGDVSNAVLSLKPMGIGHEVGKLFLRDFQQHFKTDGYTSNGPTVIKRVLEKICGTKSGKEVINHPKRCHGFHIYDPTAFYKLQDIRYFFDTKLLDEAIKQTNNSYLIHVYNSASSNCFSKSGSNTAYKKYAKENCPMTFAAAATFF